MKLYTTKTSGNGYKPRLLLEFLKVPYELAVIDLRKDSKQPEYLRLNPRGQVPTLEDAGVVVWDSAACLVYIARKHGGEQWLPSDPAQMAQVMQWLALAGNELQFGVQSARMILRGIRKGDAEVAKATGKVALEVLEGRLKDHEWLALGHPTIADIACYPYTAQAAESELPLTEYPAIGAWLKRFEALPGWVPQNI